MFVLLTAIAAAAGCAVGARYYDPCFGDYHHWNGEAVYYSEWEHSTHRNHVDFLARSEADKREFWNWRHHQY